MNTGFEINSIEKQIFEKFDEIADEDVIGEVISDSDFELREVLGFLGEPSGAERGLDLGCGKGKFCRKLKDLGFSITGVEAAEELIKRAREKNEDIEFVQASAAKLPSKDHAFDFIICIEVLEHIPDTEKAISEMARVLNRGGKLSVVDKNIDSLHYK